MMIDMANHDDGGNVTNADGSVKRFGITDSFVLPTSSTIRVPIGYVVLFASKHAYTGSPTADEYCQMPLDMTQYWHPVNGVFITDIGTITASDNIKAWGYSPNGR